MSIQEESPIPINEQYFESLEEGKVLSLPIHPEARGIGYTWFGKVMRSGFMSKREMVLELKGIKIGESLWLFQRDGVLSEEEVKIIFTDLKVQNPFVGDTANLAYQNRENDVDYIAKFS